MRLSSCPLVMKGVIHASCSCNEPFFALGHVRRSLPATAVAGSQNSRTTTSTPDAAIASPDMGAWPPRRLHRFWAPGSDVARAGYDPQGCKRSGHRAASELRRSFRAASKLCGALAAAARRSGRHEQPALVAAASGSSLPSLPPRLLCSLAAAVVDNWRRNRAGAQDGRCGWAASRGVDRPELAELCRPRARAAKGLGRCVLCVACVSC